MIELRIERGYVTATVAAGLLGVTRQRMHQLLKAGRIRGAFLMDCGDGRELWVVPRKELKPKRRKPSTGD
jgi:arylamine N-acetyltransferase